MKNRNRALLIYILFRSDYVHGKEKVSEEEQVVVLAGRIAREVLSGV